MQVDNSSAFDLVRWDFTHELLEAYGFPPCFRDMMRAIYTDLKIRLKVNGIEGDPIPVSNGVRQGCGASPLIFLLVQEALLSGIRECTEIEGIQVEVGDKEGNKSKKELKERCLADDTIVYLKNIEQLPKLFAMIEEFELASGQILNPEKSSTILLGEEKGRRLPIKGMRWVDYGIDRLDEGLGIVIGTEREIRSQWEEKLTKVSDACKSRLMELKHILSTTAKVRLIQGAYASKLAYTQEVQVPTNAEALLAVAQRKMDYAALGSYPFITYERAYQPWEDGGIGQVHLESRAKASWGSLAIELLKTPDTWKGMWWNELRKVYGDLADKDLIEGTCGFKKFKLTYDCTEL